MSDNSIFLVGSAHLDPIWLWRWQEGCGEVLQTFRSALDRLKEYDDFVFTCSSAAYYKWVEEIAPDMFAEIVQRVKEGRWVPVNGWWVQPDCNIPSGESFARHALYSQRFYLEKFGRICKTGYNVDSFGHAGTLPQLLKLGGMDSYVMMRPMENENAAIPDVFMWESPDGTRVPTFKIPEAYTASGKECIDGRLKLAEENVRRLGCGVMLFYGVGNHGGGPTRGDIEYMRALQKSGEHPGMVFASPDTYYEALKDAAKDLPVWADDLQHHASGCYSATSLVKMLNRRCENSLYTAEAFNYVAGKIAGMGDKHGALREAWQDVLFNQFHDILCGCSIMEAYRDVRDSAGHALTVADRITNEALLRIARRVDTWVEGVSDPVCEVRHQDTERFERPLVVFNPLPFPVKTAVRALNASKWVKDADGNFVPAQNVRSSRSNDSHADTVFIADLPALGYATYWRMHEGSMKRVRHSGETHVIGRMLTRAVSLENERLRVLISAENGGIVSLYNKAENYDYAAWDRPLAVPTVIDDETSDTWAHNVFTFHKIKGVMRLESIELIEAGAARAVARTRHVFGDSYLVQDFILSADDPVLRVKCKANWREKYTLLKTAFPMAGEGHENVCEIPAGAIRRPANGEEEPHQRYTSVVFRDGGETHTLALLNDSKYSYDCPGGELRLTLLRNVIFADHYSDRPAAEFNFTDEGVQRFEYGVTAAPGDADTGALTRLAAQFNLRPLVIPESFHKGDLPQRQGFIDVDADNILLTALKTCEDGSGDTVLRLYETAGQATAVTVTCAGIPAPLKAAFGKYEIKTFRFDGEKWRETDFIER